MQVQEQVQELDLVPQIPSFQAGLHKTDSVESCLNMVHEAATMWNHQNKENQ